MFSAGSYDVITVKFLLPSNWFFFFFFLGVAILQVHCIFCWTTSKLCNNTSNHWKKPKYITLTPQTRQELVHGSWVIRGLMWLMGLTLTLISRRVRRSVFLHKCYLPPPAQLLNSYQTCDVAPTVAQASLLVIGNLWLIRMKCTVLLTMCSIVFFLCK